MKKLSNIVKDKIFQCGSRNLVLKNMLYLLITQIVNYILPLITIKYLILTIGVTNFGKISFVQSFLFYFIVIIDYGFNISATRDIACCNKENKDAISKIFANTLTAKIILLTVCLFIYLYLVLLIPKFKEDMSVSPMVFSGDSENGLYNIGQYFDKSFAFTICFHICEEGRRLCSRAFYLFFKLYHIWIICTFFGVET